MSKRSILIVADSELNRARVRAVVYSNSAVRTSK